MRKKIEELRNKEDGFTLVELLAVIVILGIILAIAIPAVGRVTQRAQEDTKEAQAELIIDAAQLYVLAEESYDESLNITDLVSKGYLEASDVKDVPATASVTISGTGSVLTYVYEGYTRGATHGNPTAANP